MKFGSSAWPGPQPQGWALAGLRLQMIVEPTRVGKVEPELPSSRQRDDVKGETMTWACGDLMDGVAFVDQYDEGRAIAVPVTSTVKPGVGRSPAKAAATIGSRNRPSVQASSDAPPRWRRTPGDRGWKRRGSTSRLSSPRARVSTAPHQRTVYLARRVSRIPNDEQDTYESKNKTHCCLGARGDERLQRVGAAREWGVRRPRQARLDARGREQAGDRAAAAAGVGR